jgi:1,4-alpha-glucan branching enzyme
MEFGVNATSKTSGEKNACNDLKREIRDAIQYCYNDDAFDQVIHSKSYAEVANGKLRMPQGISPSAPESWYARRRSTLAAAMVFTAPGIPMLLQRQEFLEGIWFRDTVLVDWDQRDEFQGIVRLYRDDLIHGLCGQFTQVYHLNDDRKGIAFHRRDQGGPSDDVVVTNFFRDAQNNYTLGFPAEGSWRLRFNSDWQGYNDDSGNHPSTDAIAVEGNRDGYPGTEHVHWPLLCADFSQE